MNCLLLGLAPVALASLAGCGHSAAPGPSTGPDGATTPVRYAAPAGNLPAMQSYLVDGISGAVLPNGRFVTPAGLEVSVNAPKPHSMAMAGDGHTLITVNDMGIQPQGVFPFSVTLIRNADGPSPQASTTDIDATYQGAAFSADGARFYASGGDNGNVWVGDVATGEIIGSVNLSGSAHPLPRPLVPADPTLFQRTFAGAFPGKMVLSGDGRFLYVVDQGAFKVHVIDTGAIATGAPGAPLLQPDNFSAVVASVDSGNYPYAVALTPDGGHLLVGNVGIFRYTHLRPASPTGDAAQDYPLCYPGAGYPDETLADRTIRITPVDSANLPPTLREPGGIRCGYVTSARDYVVPGLGDPNADASSSVYVYALAGGGAQPALDRVVRTGAPIGSLDRGIATYGGSHPNAIVANAHAVYVANGNQDSISVLDPSSFAERARIPLATLPGTDAIPRGELPVDLALSADGRTLYVAEAGIDAVGVIDLGAAHGLDGGARQVGLIPTGWWPSALQLSPDGTRLFVASAKGRGAGPSSGAVNFTLAAFSPKNTTIGTVNIVPVPDAAMLATYTARVLRNNGFVASAPLGASTSPVPTQYGARSRQILHVIFLNKENATYDLLLGHITQTRAGAPVEGSPENSVGSQVVPNHTELALQFGIADNFFLEPTVSSDGHRWLDGYYATEYEELHWPAAYGQERRDAADDPDIIAGFPGRVGFSGANESGEPIDYNQHGGTFLHLVRNGRTVMNFGNNTELAGVDEGSTALAPTGTAEHVNVPMEKVVRDNSDHLYAGFNTHIPDAPQPDDPARYNRYARFQQVFDSQLAVGGECRLADYTTLYFPNDHGASPTDISPTNWAFERFIQDNDSALGLAVDLISHSPCWQDTVIFVLEDDTQNGVDHVDGHRSILMAISPWAKRQYVSHVHTSVASVFKTIYLLLGVPPLNQNDVLASDLRDLFTDTPDFTPYDYQPLSYIGAKSAATQRWIEASKGIDFSEPDADEAHLSRAIIQTLGLPKADARPLHETDPRAYLVPGVDAIRRRLEAGSAR